MPGSTSSWRRISIAVLAPAIFAIAACSDSTRVQFGDIQVTVATSGGTDPGGYSIILDGEAGQPIGANGSIMFERVQVGDHTLQLTGQAATCTVAGDNPRTVAVSRGATAETTFDVTCAEPPPPGTGSLRATVETAGDSLDADGFTLSVDGGAAQPVAVNDTLVIDGLDVGTHDIELGDVAGHCTVSPAATDTVTVMANDTVTSAFDVTCALAPEPSGAIRAITATTGADLDPDGYSVTVVDSARTEAIGVSDTVIIDGLTPGDHTIQLDPGSLAGNCSLMSSNPLTVSVADADTVDALFDVSCTDTGGGVLTNRIVFHSDRDGDLEIYVIDPVPGSTPVNLTVADSAEDQLPAISPDGSRIAFVSDRAGNNDIWVMNADGSDPHPVASAGAQESWPAWSPDGTRIVFSRDGASGFDLWVANSDGTGTPTRITSAAGDEKQADWCPAPAVCGDTVVFTGDDGNDGVWPDDLFKMSGSGGAATNLTDGTPRDTLRDGRAQWSPDGTRIAWDTNRDSAVCPPLIPECHAQIYVMNADGSGQTRLTDLDGATDYAPAWSPDGSRIAFGSKNRDGQAGGDIFIMDADGTESAGTANFVHVTTGPALDVQPDWGS